MSSKNKDMSTDMSSKSKKQKEKKIEWICSKCGMKNGTREPMLCTWHLGKCDACGKKEGVTQGRDFGIYRL